ncbi:CLUMA_CG002169, isoform A [Clunio marinus]|uniref:CLUMA_CG002169, isoform A n=1 Tax=Clunio marinus TaxID=568069 RepID=A0A1J1HK08_9DIPT|nr:CLUMA_CG002169, isoform A [Clunio marinus]
MEILCDFRIKILSSTGENKRCVKCYLRSWLSIDYDICVTPTSFIFIAFSRRKSNAKKSP